MQTHFVIEACTVKNLFGYLHELSNQYLNIIIMLLQSAFSYHINLLYITSCACTTSVYHLSPLDKQNTWMTTKYITHTCSYTIACVPNCSV